MKIMLLNLLLLNFQHSVSSAGQSVVKLERDSVKLDLQRPAETGITRIIWTFNMNKDIVTYLRSSDLLEIEDNYKDKVLFSKETFTLLVKNLQKNDSGIYRAEGPGSQVLAEYSLSVLEPVEAPVLTLVSNMSTSDSCNVTVNCTGGDQYLVSSCENTACSQDKNTSALTISIRDYIIFCNSSNPVSWKNRTMDIKPVCHSKEMEDENKWTATIAICVSLIIVLILVIMYFIVKKRKSGGSHKPDNNVQVPGTMYEEVQLSPKRDSETPATIYTTVQPHSEPDTQTVIKTDPETIYAQVKKPGEANDVPPA